MNIVNDHQLWIRQAEQDLLQSPDSFQAGRYDWAAYAAQQSAEKNLKGVLILSGVKFDYTHQLAILVQQIALAGIPVDSLPDEDDLLFLAEQNQLARYPMNDLAPRDAITESRAKRAIGVAQGIARFVGHVLK